MQENIYRQVADVIIDKNCLTNEEVKPEAKLKKDLGMDSLDIVELTMELEKEFSISIADEEYRTLNDNESTVADVVKLVESKL